MRTLTAVALLVAMLPLSARAEAPPPFESRVRWAWDDVSMLNAKGQWAHSAAKTLSAELVAMMKEAGGDNERWAQIGHLVESLQKRTEYKNSEGRFADAALRWAFEAAKSQLEHIAGLSPNAESELAKRGTFIVGLDDTDFSGKDEVVGRLKGVESKVKHPYDKTPLRVGRTRSLTRGGRGDETFFGGKVIVSYTSVAAKPIMTPVDEHILSSGLKRLLAERGVKDSGQRVLVFGKGTHVEKNADSKAAMLFEPTSGLGIKVDTPKESWKNVQHVRLVRRPPARAAAKLKAHR